MSKRVFRHECVREGAQHEKGEVSNGEYEQPRCLKSCSAAVHAVECVPEREARKEKL